MTTIKRGSVLVALFAIAVCWIWRKTIIFYGKLFGGKFVLLKELEKELPVKVYAREFGEVYTKGGAKPLTEHEAAVPVVLGIFFGVIGVIAVIMFIVNL